MRYSKTLKSLLLAGVILAPAVTLAVLGLKAFRAETLLLRERFKQDQAAIVRLISGRLSEAARKALQDLEGRCSAHEPNATLESRFRAAHPLARHIFFLRGRQLVFPATSRTVPERGRDRRLAGYLFSELDVRNYVSRLRQSRREAAVVDKGLRAEAGGKLVAARRFYARAAVGGRSQPVAQALLGLARVARRAEDKQTARKSYRDLRRRFGGRQDPEGVSFALLADAGLAELAAGAAPLQQLHARLLKAEYVTSWDSRRFYLRWTVEQLARRPLALSSELLDRLRRITAHLFAAERFGALLRRRGIAELEQLATDTISGVALDRRTILVLRRRGDTVVGYSLDEDFLRQRVKGQQRKVKERDLRLELHRVGAAPASERVRSSEVLDSPLSYWSLATLRSDVDPVKVMERRGGLTRLGFVVGLIFVLLVGLLLTYRGVRRESDLARLKSDFASNVSHELKTPLTSIRMYAEMLQEGIAADAADRRRYHRVIIRESERLGRLIANVLDFSNVERGTRRYDLRPEDLQEMTREAVETFSRLSEGEQITINFEPDGGLPRVSADREAAVQSVLNLLSNAAKYSSRPPEIDVALTAREDEVGVVVEDRGIGIPPAEQKRIFDDFYRAPGARTAGVEGTGLGLALVRRHMKASGGRVEVESAPGAGSRFTIWFAKARPQREGRGDVKDTDHRG